MRTRPAARSKKYKRPTVFAAGFVAFALEFADDMNFFLSFPFVPICFSVFSRLDHFDLRTATAQTSLILRSIALMTESILPFNTCLATLNVKPFTV
jgi:hypothetical protein